MAVGVTDEIRPDQGHLPRPNAGEIVEAGGGGAQEEDASGHAGGGGKHRPRHCGDKDKGPERRVLDAAFTFSPARCSERAGSDQARDVM